MAILVGSAEAFDCSIYPDTPTSFKSYLSNNVSSLTTFGSSLSAEYIQMAKDIYNKHNDESVLAAAKAVALSANMLFDMNIIRALLTIQEIQNAKPLMQRFIMALPEMGKLMSEQRIEAFGGMFKDAEPGYHGIERKDYRTITNGLIEENVEGFMSYKIHLDDHDEDDAPPTFRARMDIMDTWEIALQAIAEGIDPSSITGEKILG